MHGLQGGGDECACLRLRTMRRGMRVRSSISSLLTAGAAAAGHVRAPSPSGSPLLPPGHTQHPQHTTSACVRGRVTTTTTTTFAAAAAAAAMHERTTVRGALGRFLRGVTCAAEPPKLSWRWRVLASVLPTEDVFLPLRLAGARSARARWWPPSWCTADSTRAVVGPSR